MWLVVVMGDTSVRPVRCPRWSVAGRSGGRRDQLDQADEVVGGGRQFGPALVAGQPEVAQLSPAADRFGPAEDLFHPLADALADGVAGMAGGAAVDRAAPSLGVPGDVRRHLALPAGGDKRPRVIVLVRPQRKT